MQCVNLGGGCNAMLPAGGAWDIVHCNLVWV